MIVGLGHVARVGKDVAAQALCRDLGYRRVSFADPLKALALEADPMILANQMTNVGIGSGHLKRLVMSVGGFDPAKDQFPEVRRFLQNLGVGARKVFGEDFWVNQAFRDVFAYDKVVFADVRFPNEFEAIRNMGGRLIRINRPGKVASGHVSETALIDHEFDAEIDNTGSVVELEQKVVELVRGWWSEKPFAWLPAPEGNSPTVEGPVESRMEH